MGESRADTVYQQTERRLFQLLAGDESAVRGRLANLRRGAGGKPGDDPKVWGTLFSELPEELFGQRGEPSREEWAIYTALTLYAVHQQGEDPKRHNMNVKDVSLGNAASCLVLKYRGDDATREEAARKRVARRFHQIALAADMTAMTYYLRSFVQILRSEDIGLDYPMLARDLYRFQMPDGAAGVRLQWGQDFYRKGKDDETGKED